MIYQFKEFCDFIAYPIYLLRGRTPWTIGYHTQKKRTIQMAINKGYLGQLGVVSEGYGRNLDERVVEYPWVYSRLSNKADSVLDAGSALNFDEDKAAAARGVACLHLIA